MDVHSPKNGIYRYWSIPICILGIWWGYDVNVNNIDVMGICLRPRISYGGFVGAPQFLGNHGSHAPTSTLGNLLQKYCCLADHYGRKKHLKPSPIIKIVSKYRFYPNPYWIFLGNIPKNLGYIRLWLYIPNRPWLRREVPRPPAATEGKILGRYGYGTGRVCSGSTNGWSLFRLNTIEPSIRVWINTY